MSVRKTSSPPPPTASARSSRSVCECVYVCVVSLFVNFVGACVINHLKIELRY